MVGVTTVDVSTRKLMLREPAGTVTLAGTLAVFASLLDKTTIAPPPGAALASVTVACGCPWLWMV